MATVETQPSPIPPPSSANLSAASCVSLLKGAQNADGGWGHRAGGESRVEPTAWALLALQQAARASQQREALAEAQRSAFQFLRAQQLADGSWPAAPGQIVGCWATSLACWALLADPDSRQAVAAGLRWLCNDWPRSANLLRRMLRRIARGAKVSEQNESLYGWGWTPQTASWVEPTAFALLALQMAPKNLRPAESVKRMDLAKAMLYDRMCPGGGWNCGNPKVYGVAGDPSVPQTVWALLALRNEAGRTEQSSSLHWLETNLAGKLKKGLASLALAKICFDVYGKSWPAGAPAVDQAVAASELAGNVMTLAWISLALNAQADWLKGTDANG